MTNYQTQIDADKVDEHVLALLRLVIQKSDDRSKTNEVSRALLYFLVRVANTWCSIRTLRQHSPDDRVFIVDAGALLRAMYDGCFQAEYLAHDPARIDARASDYLEYEHVERHRISRKVLSHNTQLADRLKSSARRPEGEKRVQDEYDRVKDRYSVEKRKADGTVKRGPATRSTWYSGDLSALAESLGKRAEYDTFVAVFNGCVHSSALAVQAGPMVSPQHVLTLASQIAARVARLSVEHNHIDLGDFYRPIMDALCKDFLVIVPAGGANA